ncbi:helix-turn-helix domain-containing protein [Paenibacillus macerans]|uniref:helix-turn-helix domain-containing protein n=1 Tax=Paenibacillus macerans TaxID=44252 RepID=UPI002041E582|nr:helix-turn-helix domain-containing protein [Paenibacillus macerans]MCM3702084.1 helix-turn-helix domain-containing protein [Paenibacillus macerans]
MTKKLGQDFVEFMEEANQIPEVKEYLTSFSVVIGDLVMARRLQLGWTQKQLAERADTTQARISQIEAAHEGVKMGTINKVFKALGLSNINPEYREDAAGKQFIGI